MTQQKNNFSFKERRAVVACGSLFYDLNALEGRGGLSGEGVAPDLFFLESDLHRFPLRLPGAIQARIEALGEHYQTIVLGYGLCSNGIVGVGSVKQTLIVPRVHDCIDLYLGFVGHGRSRIDSGPPCYYLTPGTVLNGKDPLSIMENEYLPKMGRKNSEWGMGEELKHYPRFALITTDMEEMDRVRARAVENARFFNMDLEEIPSDLAFLKKLLSGPYDDDFFLRIPPGKRVQQKMFF
ncbi:MAG: DUF1638 domain-containing protein [Desulfobacteraceae bacterium]